MTRRVEILVVEDNADDVELLVHALRGEHLANDIAVAHDGEEALDIVFCQGAHTNQSVEIPPRVVLLDLKLPKMEGLDVLRAIRNNPRTQAIPVIIVTSSREERDLVESYKLGVNAYVRKPVNFEQFRNAVKELGLFWLVIDPPPSWSALTTGWTSV